MERARQTAGMVAECKIHRARPKIKITVVFLRAARADWWWNSFLTLREVLRSGRISPPLISCPPFTFGCLCLLFILESLCGTISLPLSASIECIHLPVSVARWRRESLDFFPRTKSTSQRSVVDYSIIVQ